MMKLTEVRSHLECLKSSSGLTGDELSQIVIEYNKLIEWDNSDNADMWGFVYLSHLKVGKMGNFSKIMDIVYCVLVEKKHIFCCDTEESALVRYNAILSSSVGGITRDTDKRYNDLVKLECFLFMKRIMKHKLLVFIEKNVAIKSKSTHKSICEKFNIMPHHYDWFRGLAYESNGNYLPPNKSIFKTKVSMSPKIFLNPIK